MNFLLLQNPSTSTPESKIPLLLGPPGEKKTKGESKQAAETKGWSRTLFALPENDPFLSGATPDHPEGFWLKLYLFRLCLEIEEKHIELEVQKLEIDAETAVYKFDIIYKLKVQPNQQRPADAGPQ